MIGLAAAILALAPLEPSGEVWIDLSQKPAAIKPGLFGQNVEAGDGRDIFGPQSTMNPVTGEGFWDPDAQKPTREGIRALKEVGATLLRFPGGCLGHGYKWKEMVGPLAERPGRPFGVMEFLRVCEEAGVQPLITAPDYAASPQDIGDLAQFLLAPADSAHPWAQKRARWGHPAPYRVNRWELGNETEHGSHDLKPFRRWTADEYCDWASDCMARIRKVDPAAKVGVHLGTSFPNVDDPWNAVVLKRFGKTADFVVLHIYGVCLSSPSGATGLNTPRLMEAAMAQGDQYEWALGRYRTGIREAAGRSIPISVTEHNALFVQEEPQPLRFSFGAALYAADFFRVMLSPDSGVDAACYWQLLNGYFGMVNTRGAGSPRSQAALPLFRMWHERFGPLWVPVRTLSPRAEFVPVAGAATKAAYGDTLQLDERQAGPSLLTAGCFVPGEGASVGPGGERRLEFKALKGERHQLLAQIPAKPGFAWRLSFEGRSRIVNARAGLSLIDGRGWASHPSGVAAEGVEKAGEWTRFSTLFEALPDCPSLTLAWRVIPVGGEASGWMELRGLSVTPVSLPHFPSYRVLTSAASLDREGRTLKIILFTKGKRPLPRVVVHAGPRAGQGELRTIAAPLAAANTRTEMVKEPDRPTVLAPDARGDFVLSLPPASMSSLEVRLKPALRK